jgi:hypothetical protein
LNARVHRDPGTAWGVAGGWNPKTKALSSVRIIYRPDHAESELSDPRPVSDVEGGFREEATGNGTSVLEAVQSGELEGEVRVTPSEDHDRASRGEQNTLRRSNIQVGEGNPIVGNQEVMLPIQSGRLEGETEIQDVKMSVYKDVTGDESRSQTRADTDSALLDSTSDGTPTFEEEVEHVFRGTVQSFIETQSGKLLELNDQNCCESCYQRVKVSETLKVTGASLGKAMPTSLPEDASEAISPATQRDRVSGASDTQDEGSLRHAYTGTSMLSHTALLNDSYGSRDADLTDHIEKAACSNDQSILPISQQGGLGGVHAGGSTAVSV